MAVSFLRYPSGGKVADSGKRIVSHPPAGGRPESPAGRGHLPAGRLVRSGAILAAGWVLLEIALFLVLGDHIGWRAVIAILVVKGGFGLILLAFVIMAAGRRFSRPGDNPASRIPGVWLDMAAAILVALPVLIPAALAPAVLAGPVRRRLARAAERVLAAGEDDDSLP